MRHRSIFHWTEVSECEQRITPSFASQLGNPLSSGLLGVSVFNKLYTKNSARRPSADGQRAVPLISAILLGVLAICIFPVFRRIQIGGVAVGTDELQCLLVFGVFIAGMVAKGLNGLARLVLLAICAGNVTFGQAAFLHFTSSPAQVPRTVQIPLFAALAGLLKFTAGLTVRATTADFLRVIHREEFPSVR